MFNLNYSIFNTLYNLARSVPYLEWVYVFLASYLPYIIVAVFVYELLRIKDLKRRFYIFFTAIISTLLSWGVITYCFHFFLHSARPFIALGSVNGTSTPAVVPLIHAVATSSFPSGHMAFLIPIALVAFLLNKRVGSWLTILTVFVGLGRIAVGVHWPSDILGGIVVGIISYFIVYKLLLRAFKFDLLSVSA